MTRPCSLITSVSPPMPSWLNFQRASHRHDRLAPPANERAGDERPRQADVDNGPSPRHAALTFKRPRPHSSQPHRKSVACRKTLRA